MKIDDFLFYCRIGRRYKGYRYIKYAIDLINEMEEDEIYLITKDIYPSIAKKFYTSTTVVESDIRTVVRHLFNEQKDILKPIFGYIPNKCPSNAQFLDALAFTYREACKNPDLIQLAVWHILWIYVLDFQILTKWYNVRGYIYGCSPTLQLVVTVICLGSILCWNVIKWYNLYQKGIKMIFFRFWILQNHSPLSSRLVQRGGEIWNY